MYIQKHKYRCKYIYKNIKTNTDKNILLLFLLPLDIGLVFLDNRIKSAYQIP